MKLATVVTHMQEIVTSLIFVINNNDNTVKLSEI